MPINIPDRRATRVVRIRQSYFPYIMLFILCALIVIFGAKPPPLDDPNVTSSAPGAVPK